MKKTRLISIIGFIIILIIIIFIFNKNKSSSISGPGIALTSKKPVPTVNVMIARKLPFQEVIYASGTILGDEEVEIHSEISGKISRISFNEAKRVKKGQILIKIVDDELKAQLKRLELKSKLAQSNEERQRLLFEKGGTSQQVYDEALNELNVLGAEIELIKAQIDKTEIKAPFDGIIGLRSISEGSYITPVSRIAVIQSINKVKMDFNIPQKYYSSVQKISEITFRFSSTEKKYTAKIFAIEPKIDPATRTIQIRTVADNSRNELIPGSFVNVELNITNEDNSFLIPTEAVVPDINGETLYIYSSGKVIQRVIKIGNRTDRDVSVVGGLSEGDTIIVSGIIQLRPKSPVNLGSIIR